MFDGELDFEIKEGTPLVKAVAVTQLSTCVFVSNPPKEPINE